MFDPTLFLLSIEYIWKMLQLPPKITLWPSFHLGLESSILLAYQVDSPGSIIDNTFYISRTIISRNLINILMNGIHIKTEIMMRVHINLMQDLQWCDTDRDRDTSSVWCILKFCYSMLLISCWDMHILNRHTLTDYRFLPVLHFPQSRIQEPQACPILCICVTSRPMNDTYYWILCVQYVVCIFYFVLVLVTSTEKWIM